MQPLSLGFSPCPNDTFMFEALANGKLETALGFRPFIHDVEKLNRLAREGALDITKVSFSNYPAISARYALLTAGAALGMGCGPLLVSKKEIKLGEVRDLKIAIPGRFTTANLLMSIFFPDAKRKTEMLFSSIEDALLKEEADAGLLIHENRFTYASRGLKKIADLGEIWEKATGSPLPLGGIAVRRSLPVEMQQEINSLLGASIRHAVEHPADVMPYVRQHAREMDEEVMRQHIALYVNNFSLDLGTEGQKAVALLLRKGFEFGLLPPAEKEMFVPSSYVPDQAIREKKAGI